MTNAVTQVPLECGHVQGYRLPYPKAGEVAYCRKCADWSKARNTVEPGAKIVCQNCRYVRNYPETVARIQGRAHAHRYPNHTVTILQDGEIIESIRGLQPLLFPDNQSLRDVQKRQAELLHRIDSKFAQ